MIKVLVVDDSGFMRLVLKKMIQDGGDMMVVGEARDGAAAVAMARELRPDVVTMDVEMPGVNGIDATRQIMADAPCAIIMVSSLMASGAVPTIQALEAGAVDFIAKKSSFVQLDIVQIGEQLLEKIRFFGNRAVRKTSGGLRSAALSASPLSANSLPHARFSGSAVQPVSTSGLLNAVSPPGRVGLVVVASSTGGPAVMQDFLRSMGQISCPVVIAQHMPALFTKGFADHMRRETQLNVIEGTDGLLLEPGMVVVTPGGTDSVVREPFTGKLNFYLKTHDNVPIHPNADVLFKSAASLSVNTVGVIMTGMGHDGTEGAKALHVRKAPILAQEPSTCVVDGMPGSAIAAGVVCRSLPPKELGQQLSRWCSR